MLLNIFRKVTALPIWTHSACAAGTIIMFQWIKGKLDASYAASQHPVDYFTGQTTFNADTIKSYYAEMQAIGTLDIYWTTQVIDFGFLLSMACIGLFVYTLIARLSRCERFGRRVGLIAGLSITLGALCDAIENSWSFIMLANPTGFADWLALPYSGFASVKFALITLGMGLVLISILCSIIGRIAKRPSIG
jgi:hypothetical protein